MAKRIVNPATTILVPYVPGKLHPDTENWAKGWLDARLVELDPSDNAAYYELLAEEWENPGELIVVEQDILPRNGTITRMLRCSAGWCTAPYTIAHGTWLDNGLGCVRFSENLRKRWPGVMVRVGYIDDDGAEPKTWRRLDTRISQVLHQLGHRHHPHNTVYHLHDYSQD